MGITINKEAARNILFAEATRSENDPGPTEWITRVTELVEACKNGNKTFIAALGTAILARATDPQVDVFALKSGISSVGYSARSLCQHVLAENSLALSIDLGVSGREPLNNQPFFAEDRITDRLPVKPTQLPALTALLSALEALSKLSTKDASAALRAFISTRRIQRHVWVIDDNADHGLKLNEYAQKLAEFVSENSEGGKRAQAGVAGVLDACFGRSRVECGRVNDPDRKFPNDVVVTNSRDEFVFSLEVRDKRMSRGDSLRAVIKSAECNVPSVGIVAVKDQGDSPDVSDAEKEARKTGVQLHVYVGFPQLVSDAALWSGQKPSDYIAEALSSTLVRLEQLEVSGEAIEQWAAISGARKA